MWQSLNFFVIRQIIQIWRGLLKAKNIIKKTNQKVCVAIPIPTLRWSLFLLFLGLVLDFLELRGEGDKPGLNSIFLGLVLDFMKLRGEGDKPGLNSIFLGLVLDFLELRDEWRKNGIDILFLELENGLNWIAHYTKNAIKMERHFFKHWKKNQSTICFTLNLPFKQNKTWKKCYSKTVYFT